MPPHIKTKVPLTSYTTLGVGGSAEYFAEVHNETELTEVVSWAKSHAHMITVIAGGSNVLIADTGLQGLVIHPKFKSMTYKEFGDTTYVTVGAGVSLDVCIKKTVEKKLWGLENLSGIPGSVGATPVQNVGAYGVEVKDIIFSVRVYDIGEEKFFDLKNNSCMFSYRDSIFKKDEGKKYIITHVTFALSKNKSPKIGYKDVIAYFGDNKNQTQEDIRNAVIEIRSKKFPDWRKEGTAGSFFKNPIITPELYSVLSSQYPEIPGYNTENGDVKISLGWVLEHVCGLKGRAEGSVRLFENQALVLVCKKGTSFDEIINFSEKIIREVYEKTHMRIEREVKILK